MARIQPQHHNVAKRVNNLGGVLRAEAQFAGAKAAYTRAPMSAPAASPDATYRDAGG